MLRNAATVALLLDIVPVSYLIKPLNLNLRSKCTSQFVSK